MSQNIGKIVQIIGPVVDVQFEEDHLPELLTAIEVPIQGQESLVLEVEQGIGSGRVRCIVMGSTDGLVRGMDAIDTGKPIQAPVGDEVLGRMFNVLGRPIDGKGDLPETVSYSSIHRDAPKFDEQSVQAEPLETGIKVIDLLCPYMRGGKIGLFGGARCW